MQIGLWRKNRTRTIPLTDSVVEQMARFVTFIVYKKVKIKFKKAKCISNRRNDLFKRKNILGLGVL